MISPYSSVETERSVTGAKTHELRYEMLTNMEAILAIMNTT